VIVFFILLFGAGYLYREKIRNNKFYIKASDFLKVLWQSMLSVKDMKRTDIAMFFLHTVFIWSCYFLMTYLIFFCFPFTSHLGFGVGLSVLVVGGLGMSAPVPGGLGAFHVFVAGALMVYGLSEQDGMTYAFLVHTSQWLSTTFFGGISFIAALLISKKRVN
jgi:glycosyltransferase 2 family protein